MDQEKFEERLGDAISSVLEKGFYEEDLGPFTVTADYREVSEEADGQRS